MSNPSDSDPYPIDCAFCKISAAYPPSPTSAVPSNPDPEALSPQCHLILSTPHVLAFLDIMPMAPGHILLTTRRHYPKLSDLHNSRGAGSSSSGGTPPRADWLALHSTSAALAASRALGEYLPILSRALCRATGVRDWNVVQNNGERAAQVVPHVHFHLIPRYAEGARRGGGEGVGAAQMKSWRMFGRGTREDLDDEEGRALARRLREEVRREIGEGGERKERGKL